ncbi:MAG: hypothetical protein M3393_04475 [Actinomycetota bacterium]|nr:hypothetical protein [Actinomycetota bacterium]
MAERVFLHIGAPKTGTTFLQTVMWHNKPVMQAQGYLYPGNRRMDHFRATRVVRGISKQRLGDASGIWDDLLGELRQWSGTGVITHEFFSRANAKRAEKAIGDLAPAEVHLVFTARDYVRQFPAVWQEALKMSSQLSFDEFVTKALEFDTSGPWGWQSQDIPAILNRWGQSLPPERVHVITVPPPGAPRDLLWERWCAVLGLDASKFDLDVGIGNESVGAAQAALLHRIKPHLSGALNEGGERHRWFRQYLGHEVLVPQRGERFGLRPQHWAELRQLSASAAKAIEEAGYDVTGDLTELVPDAEPTIRPNPDDIPDAEIVDVAARAIEQMVRDVRELTLERDEAKRRAAVATQRARARGSRIQPRSRGRRLARRMRSRVRRMRASNP